MKIRFSLIVPCYNEESVLEYFYRETSKVLSEMNETYEMIFVDDGSKDGTLYLLRKFAASDEHITYLSFSRNFGKEAALYAGLCNANGEYVVVMDADMQDPPTLLPQMYALINNDEYDCVATRRVSRKGEPPIRSFFAKLFYLIINRMSDADIVDGARDFRMMKRDMVEAILRMREYNRFSKGIFGWIGFRTYWLEYENVERVAGETKWNFWGLFKYALDGIINFSQTPLTVMAFCGFITTFAAIVGTVFVFVRRLLFGDPVQGWASMMCVIVLLGGLQMFFMGIIGQYLAKMYLEVKNRPHFIIAETNREEVGKIG